MIDLQNRGAANINLVTPTHVLPQIVAALPHAIAGGLHVPLVWNSGGYDSLEALALLDGIIDVYLPDMKYSDAALGHKFSVIRDYPTVNRLAVQEMYRQVGHLAVDSQDRVRRGLLVRHLVMPGQLLNTEGVLRWIAAVLGPDTYLSLMDQYRPAYRAFANEKLAHAMTPDEYAVARRLAESLGLHRLDDSLTL
jgi:putative pyruvate formate lyase activating enzyme